jgi:serine/threonine protein kinase
MKAKEQVLAIQNEIAILKTLKSHPSIVSYLGTDRHGMDLYILMEYVPGGSIAQQIKMHGALNEGLCRKWTYEILEGLHHLHSNGIAHRDIKGANILVTSTGSIKLADFGSAAQKQMGMCGPDGFKSVRGTPFWMAPEVVMGETYGWPADIWSLGCTVLEMINGKPPWFDLGQIGALNALAKKIAVPPIPDSMADLGKDFVNACLSYQPDMRPDSQTLLAYDWLAEQAEAAELKAAEKAREAAGLESESKKQRVRPGRLSRDSSRSSHTDMDSFDKIPIKQHNSWVGASDYINSARKSPSPPLATSSPSHQLLDQVKSPTFKTQLRFSLRSNSNLTKKDRGRKSSVQPEARGSTSVKSPSPDDNLSDFEELTQHSESESSNDLEAAPYNGTRPHQIRQQFSDDDLLGQLGSSGTSRSSDSLVPGGLTPGEARMSPLYPPQTPQSLPTLPPVHSPVVDNGAYCQEWLSSPDSPGGTTLPPSQSGRSMRIRTKVLSSCLQLEKLQKHGQMALSTASQ